MGYQPPAHLLIALALFKGVAGAVAILKEGQRAAGKPLPDEFADDGLLVLDGDVVPVQLVVHRDPGVARNVKAFEQGEPPFMIWIGFPILFTPIRMDTDNIV